MKQQIKIGSLIYDPQVNVLCEVVHGPFTKKDKEEIIELILNEAKIGTSLVKYEALDKMNDYIAEACLTHNKTVYLLKTFEGKHGFNGVYAIGNAEVMHPEIYVGEV